MNGYKIIDFKGENFVEGTVAGIWNAVDTATKPLVFYNYCIGEDPTILKPFFAGFGKKSTYTAGHYQYIFLITTDPEGVIISLSIKDDDTIAIETV